MTSSIKTSRTGFDSERPAARLRYAEARAAGKGHKEALSTAAKGLPLHMLDDWTQDLQATFDSGDADAKDLALVYAVLQNGGKIVRTEYVDTAAEHDRRWEPGF